VVYMYVSQSCWNRSELYFYQVCVVVTVDNIAIL